MLLIPILFVLGFDEKAATPDPPKVTVKVDASEAPDLEPWAKEGAELMETWYPKIATYLASDGYTPPDHVRLVFKKDKRGVADTSGTRISVAAKWVEKHPEDRGMLIHELCHVIQSYPNHRPGWLIEGIADYVRFFQFEPETKIAPPNPRRSKYTDSYRTTAAFLDYVQRTRCPDLVPKLNAALRKGTYEDSMFKDLTGDGLDALWKAYVESFAEEK